MKPVRDAFADALGALLALGMNPDAQVSLSVFSICSLFIAYVVTSCVRYNQRERVLLLRS